MTPATPTTTTTTTTNTTTATSRSVRAAAVKATAAFLNDHRPQRRRVQQKPSSSSGEGNHNNNNNSNNIKLRPRRKTPAPVKPAPPSSTRSRPTTTTANKKKQKQLLSATATAIAVANNKRRRQLEQQKQRRIRNPSFLICPTTGTQVWIAAATLQDIQYAARKGKHPWSSGSGSKNNNNTKRQYLVQVHSPAARQAVYDRAAYALQVWEERLLPDYGGRPWKVVVRISDPTTATSTTTATTSSSSGRSATTGRGRSKQHSSTNNKPYFCWHKGQLELAAWPHIVDKIPEPPKFPGFGGKKSAAAAKRKAAAAAAAAAVAANKIDNHDNGEEEDAMQVDESSDEESLSEDEIALQELQERPASVVSQLAWQERWRVPLPNISIKWISPLLQSFTTRKSAWEHAIQLCKQEVLIDKVLMGYGASGQALKVQTPSRKVTLEAGKLRFERDGLWVIGQEQQWQYERLSLTSSTTSEQQEPTSKEEPNSTTTPIDKKSTGSSTPRKWTGLTYYLQCRRKDYQQQRLHELKQQQQQQQQQQQEQEPKETAVDDDTAAKANAATTKTAKQVPGDEATEQPQPAAEAEAAASESTEPTAVAAAAAADSEAAKGDSMDLAPAGENNKESLPSGENETAMEIDMIASAPTMNTVPEETETAMEIEPSPSTFDKKAPSSTTTEQTGAAEAQTTNPRPDVDDNKAGAITNNDSKKVSPVESATSMEIETSMAAVLGNKSASEKNETAMETEASPSTPAKMATSGETVTATEIEKNTAVVVKRAKISFTLRDAETELREIWKTLSDEERKDWTDRAKALREKEESQKDGTEKPVVAATAADTRPSPNDGHTNVATTPTKTGRVTPSSDSETAKSSHYHDESSNATTRALVSPSPTHEKPVKSKVTPAVSKPSPASLLKPGPSSKWCMSERQVQLCYDACVNHFNQIMRTVKARDLTRELQDGFDLLRERGRGRYDMELPAFDTADFNFLTDLKKAPWMTVVKEILGNDVVLIHKGAFLSMPDAETQPYHQDGLHLTTQYQKPCHAINVFIPLVDLTTQGTEFCLGSHILGNEDHDRDFVYTPQVSAGTPIIFDYRLGHRGLGNSTQTIRPVVYCTYAAAANGKEFRDTVNFSRKRYHRIGDLVSKAPTRDERAKKRERSLESQSVEQAIAASLADSDNMS